MINVNGEKNQTFPMFKISSETAQLPMQSRFSVNEFIKSVNGNGEYW